MNKHCVHCAAEPGEAHDPRCPDATPPARETWRVHHDNATEAGYARPLPIGISDGRGALVARCPTAEHAESIARDHNAVEAMREALRAMVGAMDRRGDEGEEFSESELDAYRKARAALAQAGGE